MSPGPMPPGGLPLLAGGALPAGPLPVEVADASRVWLANGLLLSLALAGAVVGVGLLLQLRARPVDWAACARRLAWRPWHKRDGLRLGGLLVLLQFAAVVLAAHVPLPPSEDLRAFLALLLQSAGFHGVVLLAVFLLLRRRRLSWRSGFGFSAARAPADARVGAVFYLAALPLVMIYSLLYRVLLIRAGYPPEPQPVFHLLAEARSPALQFYVVFVGIALAPFAEEVFFRGLLLPLALRRLGAAGGVLVVSALFAALHFHVPSLVPLFVIGVAFSLAYLYSGSLLVPIVMHAVFNGVNLGVLFLLR